MHVRFAAILLFALSPAAARAEENAAVATAQVTREMTDGIAQRGQQSVLKAYCDYAGKLLDDSAGSKTWSDKTGNCRLKWVDHLLRHPLEVFTAGEQFTAQVHQALQNPSTGLTQAISIVGGKLDAAGPGATSAVAANPGDALQTVKHALAAAKRATSEAWAPLSHAEQTELAQTVYPVTTGEATSGAFLAKARGRRVCDLAEKLDRAALVRSAHALAPLADPALLARLAELRSSGPVRVAGAEGEIYAIVATDSGKIIVGGPAANTYRLDEMLDVAAVIDVGGNDNYLEGTVDQRRPVLVLLDLAGNDTYRAARPGAQGAAIGGAALLVDRSGNDVYEAKDVAQGACLAGVGMLIDMAGNDSYRAMRRVQGSAVAGIALLVDRAGKDEYRCALWGQGCGGPLGGGVLDDLAGKDHYFAGGHYPDPYDDSPGFDAWSQGVGCGPRGTANGGIGVLLDGGGDDVYECDYFSHGGGYWFAAGFARDFGGNDQRVGATRTMLDGTPRKEVRFLRYGVGYAAHYAIGLVIDDDGNDEYGADMAGCGFAWDISVAGLLDFGGNDRYTATGGSNQGQAAQLGMAVLFDQSGDDQYAGTTAGFASGSPEYHRLPTGGGDFSFVVDYGGSDKYAVAVANNAVHQRGAAGGFIIDRAAPPPR